MITSRSVLWIPTILSGVLIGACNFRPANPVPAPPGERSLCSAMEMVAPVQVLPLAHSIEGLQPQFEWGFPIYCDPSGYRVEVCSYQSCDFPVFTADLDADQVLWTIAEDLFPGEPYTWRVAAYLDEGGAITVGPWSAQRPFYTGPICALDAFNAPLLQSPSDGASVNVIDTAQSNRPTFHWFMPGLCLAESYRIEISSTMDFSQDVLSRQLSSASTSWTLDTDLSQNTRYYWRVAASDGNTSGPWSDVRSFLSDLEPSSELAVVAGIVWHDQCFIDWEGSSAEPPPGCIPGDPYPQGDGIRQEGEPGIPGVIVSYLPGDCPSGWDMGQSRNIAGPTTSSGWYYQWLGPGNYCVGILLSQGHNNQLFNGGRWTAPGQGDTYSYRPMAEVNLAPGEVRDDLDFGYDFIFGSSSTPARITARVWADGNADGLVDAGEPGIDDIDLWLTLGLCSENYLERQKVRVTTSLDGSYLFDYLNPGIYCVVLDRRSGHNDDWLSNGEWTTPIAGADLRMQQVQVTLEEGQVIEDVNFGWHYYLPGQTEPFTAVPTAGPQFLTPQATSSGSIQPTPAPGGTVQPANTPPVLIFPTRTPTFRIVIPPTPTNEVN